ncbi:hypothetical protein [Sulfurimonas sp. NW9]|uniref:hypothetical protein n=1 Tax=Sulfurimonas sp. NW9 TaxID=2922728 RepID=UPI003DA7FAD6
MQLQTTSSTLEQSIVGLHTDSPASKEWFYDSVIAILTNDKLSFYKKSDIIAEIFLEINSRVAYIKEQQQHLASMKKQLESAKTIGKFQVAKALQSLGVEKLEGLSVSSISVTKESTSTTATLKVLDEQALIHAGFFTVVLDKEAVQQALISADQRHEVQDFCDMKITTKTKPITLRINKRKSLTSDDSIQHIQAA